MINRQDAKSAKKINQPSIQLTWSGIARFEVVASTPIRS
jgi:hypothetical protein